MGGDGGVGQQQGSSPRGRGKRSRGRGLAGGGRLIPARAGKTHGVSFRGYLSRGSSPRGRGKLSAEKSAFLTGRLIPARAGKTCATLIKLSRVKAHPRAGGENQRRPLNSFGERGSSPRGRGKRVGEQKFHGGNRLIPARAGKTRYAHSNALKPPAHPRAGGENPETRSERLLDPGSSPRGRGKRSTAMDVMAGTGLIPARAGKTRRAERRSHSLRAHPRAGGENV